MRAFGPYYFFDFLGAAFFGDFFLEAVFFGEASFLGDTAAFFGDGALAGEVDFFGDAALAGEDFSRQ